MALVRQMLFTFLSLTSTFLFGQIPKTLFSSFGIEEYSSRQFTSKTLNLEDRIGVYHFGESESEWDLVLIKNNDSLIIQVWDGIWVEDLGNKKIGWIRRCKTFNSVKLINNKFFFGKYSGLFAEFNHNKKFDKTVLLVSSPTLTIDRQYGKDSAEVGFFNSTLDTFFNDKDFPELSLKIQTDNYFKGKSKQELKIMRNSIYAKYGQTFQVGGEMDKYFTNKEWYKPFQKETSNCLTEIEKKNIQTIVSLEQQ
jgi:hypothetical protein